MHCSGVFETPRPRCTDSHCERFAHRRSPSQPLCMRFSQSLKLLLSTIVPCAVGHPMGYKDLLNYSNIWLMWSWSHRLPDKMSEQDNAFRFSPQTSDSTPEWSVVPKSRSDCPRLPFNSITLIYDYTYTGICLVSFPTSGNCHLFCILWHQDQ